jgi:ADP-ribose pyrophosphatase
MSLDSWKLLKRARLFSAEPWFTIYCDMVELPGGRILNDFYKVVMPDFAVVVPITDANEIVMVRGYKHGLGRVSLSTPAGYIDPGETPAQAASRELLEETGYAASEWHALGSFMLDGNRHCGVAHLYLARHATKMGAATQADPDESLELELIRAERFFDLIRNGELALLPTISAVCLALLSESMTGTAPRDCG